AAPEVYLPALHALTLVINSAGLQVANSGYGKGAIVLLLSRLLAEVRKPEGCSLSPSSWRRCPWCTPDKAALTAAGVVCRVCRVSGPGGRGRRSGRQVLPLGGKGHERPRRHSRSRAE